MYYGERSSHRSRKQATENAKQETAMRRTRFTERTTEILWRWQVSDASQRERAQLTERRNARAAELPRCTWRGRNCIAHTGIGRGVYCVENGEKIEGLIE